MPVRVQVALPRVADELVEELGQDGTLEMIRDLLRFRSATVRGAALWCLSQMLSSRRLTSVRAGCVGLPAPPCPRADTRTTVARAWLHLLAGADPRYLRLRT
jgi:hypothetical protein